MPDWANDGVIEKEGGVLTEPKQKLKKPALYKILLHNDDFTSMEFVVSILETVFHKSQAEATQIMLAVHLQGIGIAGVYTYEVAESKINKVIKLAQEEGFPLLCTMEEM